MLNYWLKIASGDCNKLSNIVYRITRSLHKGNKLHSDWLAKIHSTLNNIGLGYIWNQDPSHIHYGWFKNILSIRISDISKQNLNSAIDTNGQCTTYSALKTVNMPAPYLSLLPLTDRIPVTKMRCLNNKLPIITGRFQNIDMD